MKIIVTFHPRRFSTVEVESTIAIKQVNEKLMEMSGLLIHYQHLVYGEKWLPKDYISLEAYGVNEETLDNMSMKLELHQNEMIKDPQPNSLQVWRLMSATRPVLIGLFHRLLIII